MLHIILFILKLLGLLILILSGLILLAVLLVLFVPVRYRGEGSYYNRVKGNMKISWLLHILSVTVRYENEILIVVRLFGFQIMKPKKMDEEMKEAEEIMVQAMEVKEPETVKEARRLGEDVKDTILKDSEPQEPQPSEHVKRMSWIRTLYYKIKKKFIHILNKIRHLYMRICDTWKNMKNKKEEIQAFLTNTQNQKTAKLLFRQVKRLIHHIFPVKGHGTVTFGFEDPGLTGQVLMAASMLYPFFHKNWNLYPVFDQPVFTAEGTFQGRVRLGTVLVIGLRMFLDKNFRVLLKRWLR
ncbi:DUF2953 domain-containing protein [Lacrimispora amygdalina]|uniref:DUF2953 domain-containing protein n=1 Tax=Lacrimispora amygdalina TaxID=253257 RepID=UPI000BE469A1|nr:DUF2953 domain-containing protein [Lacrimispora amygdalina]